MKLRDAIGLVILVLLFAALQIASAAILQHVFR